MEWIVGAIGVIVSGVFAWMAKGSAEAANRLVRESKERGEKAEQPNAEFADLKLYHVSPIYAVFTCTVVNNSSLPEAVMELESLDLKPVDTEPGRHVYILNHPAEIVADPTMGQKTIPHWPHALPVNVPPFSTVTFMYAMHVSGLPKSSEHQRFFTDEYKVKLHFLRDKKNHERKTGYDSPEKLEQVRLGKMFPSSIPPR